MLGISGGIDSSVVAYLSKRALGKNRVTGLLLFEDDSKDSGDYNDARRVISETGIRELEFPITSIIDAYLQTFREGGFDHSRVSLGNIKARTRMALNYAVANERNLLVAGTGDRSEEEIGYFTKYGDGGADFLPIAHIYKTELRELTEKLGVPKRIIEKPSSPNLWKGHKATDEIPADYPKLDRILRSLYEQNKTPKETSRDLKILEKIVYEVAKRHDASEHKRKYPPSILDWESRR